jgi:hypothetical protein
LLGNKLFEEKRNNFTNGETFEQSVAKNAVSYKEYRKYQDETNHLIW